MREQHKERIPRKIKMTYNLFIEHHEILQTQKGRTEIGSGWEDNFTNILSFYLSFDSEALNNFCRLTLKEDFDSPVSIETQVGSIFGRPDIVIKLSSGSQLIVECKVDASLQPDQLQRYLKIKPPKIGCNTFVVLFSKKSLAIPSTVTENVRYKSPIERPHYFWTDLFYILPKSGTDEIGIDAARWSFRNYIEMIGFAPSSLNKNWYQLYEDRTIDENQRIQKEFGRKLAPIRSWMTDQGFKVTAVSHKGLQAVPKSGCMQKAGIYFMVLGPEISRKDLLPREAAEKLDNEVLRLALIYNSFEVPEQAWTIYEAFPFPLNDQHGNSWWVTKPYKFNKTRVRLEFVANLNKFLENENEIEMRIMDSCKRLIEHLYSIL